MEKNRSQREALLQNALINEILFASTIVAIAAFVFAEIRAVGLGWSYRDLLQLIAVCGIICLTAFRNKLNTHFKALFIIISLSLGGAAGVYSLGILAGTLFIFPSVTVIMAILYPVRATWTYIVLYVLFFCFVGFMFCSERTVLPIAADLLTTKYSHWIVYFICIGFFFTVSSVTIYSYRREMELLLDEITFQKDELVKTNQDLDKKNNELRVALGEVKTLSGLLPICISCKKIRDDKGYWNKIETYISEHSEAKFSHGICQECEKKLYPDYR